MPGNIRLMEMAHERHGRLAWARLFAPAIRLARDGFAITPRMRRALAEPDALAGTSPWGRAQFYGADGQPKPVGTLVRNPELAAFLEQVAARGPEHFYTGAAAEALVRTVRNAERNPSPMTRDDLATYQARERRAGVRDLSRLPDLRDGAALVGRDHGVRDPEAARAVRPARAGPGQAPPPGT